MASPKTHQLWRRCNFAKPSIYPETQGKSQNNRSLRAKYTCPFCQSNVWGKPSLSIICGKCRNAGQNSIEFKET
jgi:hypothetical protein